MASVREVTGSTFGNDATLILGNIINNITNVNTDPFTTDRGFLQEISKTNPVDDKKRILESKGPLIYDSYSWILEHSDFRKWRYKQNNGIFWIKGDPGKGKTMLLCGIIEDFKSESKLQEKFAYFFCQGTDTRLNTATGIIKGLIYSILQRNQTLLSSIQKHIEKEPKGYLEGTNAWAALSRIFTTIIQDPCMAESTFIIDALDECQHQESCKSLLNLIMDTSNRVKWLISSRNERQIERGLKSIDNRRITELIMEHKSNAAHISNAVDTYIDRCARDIEGLEGADDLRDKTVSILKTKANGTFLWVTLVAQQLRDAGRPHIERILEEMPEDLERLYDEIMERSKKGWKNDTEACLCFLATVTAAERPLHIDELYLFTSSQLIGTKVRYLPSDIEYLAKACGSFITIMDKTIYFIHQSVKDYMTHKGAISIFPRGIEHQHFKMFEGSLKILHKVLRYDIYNIRIPGEHMDEVTPPNPNPLASKAYCCAFWIEHLAHCRQPRLFQDGGILHSFLKEKYLYWLEAMVLLKLLPHAVLAIQRLRDLITNHFTMDDNSTQIYELPHARKTGQVENDYWPANTGMSEEKSEILTNSERKETLELTRDVYRLVFSHRAIIEVYPLQIYASAFIFSPSESILRKLFGPTQCPNWIVYKPQTSPNWSPCIQTIESYDTVVRSVAISPDNTILAAVAYYGLAKVWDLMSGALLRTFQTEDVKKVIFSSDSIHLVLINSEKAEIWNLITGTHLNTVDGEFESASFCADGTHLALMGKTTVEIRNLATNEDFHTYNCSSSELLLTFIFPSDCAQLNSGLRGGAVRPHSTGVDTGALALADQTSHIKAVIFDTEVSTIKVQDLATGRCLQTTAMSEDMQFPLIEGEFTLSSDGMRVAIAGYSTIDIWDLATSNCLQTLGDPYYHNGKAMAFSADGLRLASTRKKEIKIWDIVTGTCLQTFSGHTDYVYPLAYSLDGLRLVSGSADCTIKVWDLAAKISPPTKVYSECEDQIDEVAISPNGRWIALGSRDKTVRIWDTATRTFLRTMKMTYVLSGIAFSPDSMQLATADGGYAFKSFWDRFTGAKFRNLEVSFNNTQSASTSSNGFIKIWDLTSGKCIHTIRDDRFADLWIEFSPSDTSLGWHLFRPDESHITIWGLIKEICAHETLSDPTGWKPKELNLHRSKQMEIPFAYFSQGRQFHYNDELPMLSLNADETWILKSKKPLLWLPPDYRPKLYLIYKNYILIIDKYNNWLHFEFCFDDIDS